MIIIKDKQERIRVIAGKMAKLGFGTKEDMIRELSERFVAKELKELLDNE